MSAAQKKKPIGFITSQDTGHKTQDTKPPAGPFAKKGPSEPEGPMLGLRRIRLAPGAFRSIAKSSFVKMRLKSNDGLFAIDLILRDADARLQLVPSRMPEISIHMEPQELSGMEARTIFMLEDGMGNNRGYAIASVRQAELLNNGWTKKKHMVS